MPVVPTYTPTQSLPLGTNLPKMDSNIGAGVMRAAQGVAAEAKKQVRQYIAEYDETRVTESYNDFRETDRQKLIELKRLEGKDAKGAADSYREWFEKESKEISADLDNITQQDAFKAKSTIRRENSLNTLGNHEAVQLRQYKISVHDGELEHAYADVITQFTKTVYASTGEADLAMADIEKGVVESYARTFKGLDTDAARMKAIASLRVVRIQAAVDRNNIGEAERLLEKYADSLGPAYEATKDFVKTNSIGLEAENIAFASFQKYKTGEMKADEIRTMLRDQLREKDPALYSKTLAAFNSYARTWKTEQVLMTQEAVNNSIVTMDSLPTLKDKFNFLAKLPKGTPAERAAFKSAQAQYNHAARFVGLDVQTDPTAFEKLSDGLIGGDITNVKALEGNPNYALVAKPQREFLKKQLKDSQGFKLLKFRFEQTMGKKYSREEWLNFLKFAEPVIKRTNRGKDEKLLQQLIDDWRSNSSGEIKGGGWSRGKPGVQKFFGLWDYGKNISLQQAARSGDLETWLPKLSEIPDADVDRIKAGFAAYPQVKQAFIEAYGSEEAALRGYYRDNRFSVKEGN